MQPDVSVRRVLIYRLGSLGDTAVALPCFHLIERTFPSAKRMLLTNFPVHSKAPASAAVLGDSGLVDGYMRYTVGTRNPMELLRVAWEIRRFAPDVLVYLRPVREMSYAHRDRRFFQWAAGVKRIVGLPGPADLIDLVDPETGTYTPESIRLARTLRELGDAAPEKLSNWNLRLSLAEEVAARSALGELAGKPLIVCGPGTKMQAKDWGQENWRSLLANLSRRHPGHVLALIGAKEDAEVSDYAAQEWLGPKVNLCGRLSPRETAAVFEYAQIFLGPDSGPMHLAACAGVPCVIAFSARGLPGVWYPTGKQHQVIYHRVNCFGCNLETCIVENRKCLTTITVDEMVFAADSVLSRRI